MTHAYLIMAFSEYDQLKMLIEMLDYPGNDIYIHIDKKSPDIDEQNLTENILYSRVKIYKEIEIFWGHYSQTACEVFLLEQAVKHNYGYLHLLSGADLPISSQGTIRQFFLENSGKEFVRYWGDQFPPQCEAWVRYYHPLQKYLRATRNRAVNKGFEAIEKGIEKLQSLVGIDRLKGVEFELQKGATWFSITGEFAKYVVQQKPWIEKRFRNTRSSDEIFLQTILHNSEFENKRFENTYELDGLTGIRYIDWKRGNPYIFRQTDYEELMSCGFLFARKFSINTDRKIVEELHDRITELNRRELALYGGRDFSQK